MIDPEDSFVAQIIYTQPTNIFPSPARHYIYLV